MTILEILSLPIAETTIATLDAALENARRNEGEAAYMAEEARLKWDAAIDTGEPREVIEEAWRFYAEKDNQVAQAHRETEAAKIAVLAAWS